MNLSPHFTLQEFTASDTAARRGFDNSLPTELIGSARVTAEMMEKIRAHLGGVPIHITSGYRCPDLNRAVGSSGTSDHLKAAACDFRAPAFGTPLDICRSLVPMMSVLGIGQIIYEFTWVHVSTRTPDKIINRVLTVNGKGYVPGIQGG